MVWHADPVDRPAAPSAWGEVAGSMVGQVHPPQLGSERELCPHTTGYSSQLRGIVANLYLGSFQGPAVKGLFGNFLKLLKAFPGCGE